MIRNCWSKKFFWLNKTAVWHFCSVNWSCSKFWVGFSNWRWQSYLKGYGADPRPNLFSKIPMCWAGLLEGLTCAHWTTSSIIFQKPFFFFCHITCVGFLSPEETFKFFIIFYFWLINTDMTDVIFGAHSKKLQKNNNIFFPSGVFNETIQI